jgi:hypothetical protein
VVIVIIKYLKLMNKKTYRKPNMFNMDEMRHLAINYAINCMKGYDGSFDDWYNNLSKDWIEIANKPLSLSEIRIIKIKKIFKNELK